MGRSCALTGPDGCTRHARVNNFYKSPQHRLDPIAPARSQGWRCLLDHQGPSYAEVDRGRSTNDHALDYGERREEHFVAFHQQNHNCFAMREVIQLYVRPTVLSYAAILLMISDTQC